MNIKRLLFFSITLAALLASCKTGRNLAGAPLKERSPDYLLRKMIDNQVDAKWLSAKLKVNHKSEELTIGFTGNLRLCKDSLIWIQVKKFGFEVARAQVTKDSVFVIDRIHNEYTAAGMDYIRQMINFPANFEMLQALLLGNPVFFTKNLSTEIVDNEYKLGSTESRPKSEYRLDRDYLLKRMFFPEEQPERKMSMELDKYQPAGKRRNFSYLRKLNMSSRETGNLQVDLEFSDLEFDVPKSTPFEVPSGYPR
ncbi:MAG TPA: DUF4292 domain-containing protein [Saprospiraceae bacterium]|nr:DUF4292 domain-containing protein [Saprospiraceae bacterium]